ncbi:MAG: hypothetical protein OXC99_00245 [Chloroflexi bacterium]|nr:hypothetical protein [Chloroflexota bacterium]
MVDDPNTNIEAAGVTPWAIALFTIALADGLLDAEERGVLDAAEWTRQVEALLMPQVRSNPRLTAEDVSNVERLFAQLQAVLVRRRRRPKP